MTSPLRIALLSLVVLAGCAASTPRVKVLGVSEAQSRDSQRMLVVFVEVVNPTHGEIQLSKLEYRLEASPWFASTGRVTLGRVVAADSSAIVEIPVAVNAAAALGAAGSVAGDVPFRLSGRLFDRTERSWNVVAEGALDRKTGARVVLGPK